MNTHLDGLRRCLLLTGLTASLAGFMTGCDDHAGTRDADARVDDGAVTDAALTDAARTDAAPVDADESDAALPCDEITVEVEDDGAPVCADGFPLDLWEGGATGAAWRWRLGGQCDAAVAFVDVDVPEPPPPGAFLPDRLIGSYVTGLAERPGGTSRWIGGRDVTDPNMRPLGQLVEGEARSDGRCLSGSARLILTPPSTDNVDPRPRVELTVRWRGPATPPDEGR